MKWTSVTATATSLALAGASHALDFDTGGVAKGVKPTFVEGFQWRNPFKSDAAASFDAACRSVVDFPAREYTLHQLTDAPPRGLKPWAPGLKKLFADKEYPGSWAGLDRHRHDRSILLMGYADVPVLVREWIEEQERAGGEGKALFAVFDKHESVDDEFEDVVVFPGANEIDRSKDEGRVAIFAPGALYGILPLWVAEGSKCLGDLTDLSKYATAPSNNSVVAWVDHTIPQDNKIKLHIRAEVLRAKGSNEAKGPAGSGAVKEEL